MLITCLLHQQKHPRRPQNLSFSLLKIAEKIPSNLQPTRARRNYNQQQQHQLRVSTSK